MGQYSEIFGCVIGILPFIYFGITINHRKLNNNKDGKTTEDLFQKKVLSSERGILFFL